VNLSTYFALKGDAKATKNLSKKTLKGSKYKKGSFRVRSKDFLLDKSKDGFKGLARTARIIIDVPRGAINPFFYTSRKQLLA